MPLKTVGTYIFSGLFTEGVKAGGHHVLAHLEDGDFGVETSKLNNPEMPHFTIRDKWPRAMLKEMDIDLIYGNPPCAGFSMASRNRGAENPLNMHLTHANEMAMYVQPKAFVVESVTQMFQMGDQIVQDWEHRWHTIGYQTCRLWENSGHLGLPQQRKRALFIASRANLDFSYPHELQPATVRDAIGDLVNVEAVEKTRVLPPPQPYTDFAFTPFQAMARKDSGEVTAHCYQRMNAGYQSLMPHLEPGKRIRAISDEIYEETYWKNTKHRGGKPSFLTCRLRWDKPSSVITGGVTYVHPELDRFLTIRESARLMGLPDTFQFSNTSHAYAEVGKAVSPVVGRWLADQLEGCIRDPLGRAHQPEVVLL